MKEDLKETLEMVADYTEEEKSKILNNIFFYGLCSTIVFVLLLIMYAFNLHNKSDFLNSAFICMFYLGGIFTLSTVFAGLQLQGKMSKERRKKIVKIALPVCIIAMVLLTVIIMAAIA